MEIEVEELFGRKKRYCYQCDKEVIYLFNDGRGGCCTRLTPEEIQGTIEDEMDYEED